VAFLVLPDVSPDVEASTFRELPGIVRADPRIAAVGTVNFVVRFLFAGVRLSTVVLYNVFGDLGSTLGPPVALPLEARVGFAGEYVACAVLALGVGVLVSRTLLGIRVPRMLSRPTTDSLTSDSGPDDRVSGNYRTTVVLP